MNATSSAATRPYVLQHFEHYPDGSLNFYSLDVLVNGECVGRLWSPGSGDSCYTLIVKGEHLGRVLSTPFAYSLLDAYFKEQQLC